MPALGEAFRAHPLQAVMNSHFDGPLSFVVGLDSPDGRYRVHMNLSGVTWRLSGLDIPERSQARMARLIAQRMHAERSTSPAVDRSRRMATPAESEERLRAPLKTHLPGQEMRLTETMGAGAWRQSRSKTRRRAVK